VKQTELFDPSRTVATPCAVPGCGAIRLPGQHKVPTCQTDLSRATEGWTRTRPRACLNQPQPSDRIPY
jgi:hypothetical protein